MRSCLLISLPTLDDRTSDVRPELITQQRSLGHERLLTAAMIVSRVRGPFVDREVVEAHTFL
jgi:hypothetical protein